MKSFYVLAEKKSNDFLVGASIFTKKHIKVSKSFDNAYKYNNLTDAKNDQKNVNEIFKKNFEVVKVSLNFIAA